MDKQIVKIGPVSKDLLYLKVADAIYAYAKANHLKAGDKLPSERDMAAMFETGRNSVREALRVLENRGLIEVKTGRGAFLKESSDAADSVYFRLIKCDFEEIQELKITLEKLAIHKAIFTATIAQKKELLDIAQNMVLMAKEGIYSDAYDHTFHEKLLEIGGNQTVRQLVMQMRIEVFDRYWALIDYDNTKWIETVPYHLTIAQAIIDNDEARANEAMDQINAYTIDVLEQARAKDLRSDQQ